MIALCISDKQDTDDAGDGSKNVLFPKPDLAKGLVNPVPNEAEFTRNLRGRGSKASVELMKCFMEYKQLGEQVKACEAKKPKISPPIRRPKEKTAMKPEKETNEKKEDTVKPTPEIEEEEDEETPEVKPANKPKPKPKPQPKKKPWKKWKKKKWRKG